jgi:hypothetical protein
MLELACELDLDTKMMWRLAERAVELAGEEHNRLMGELNQVWSMWA